MASWTHKTNTSTHPKDESDQHTDTAHSSSSSSSTSHTTVTTQSTSKTVREKPFEAAHRYPPSNTPSCDRSKHSSAASHKRVKKSASYGAKSLFDPFSHLTANLRSPALNARPFDEFVMDAVDSDGHSGKPKKLSGSKT